MGTTGVITYTNDSSYSGSVTELRIYKNKNFVVSAASGYKITKIVMTCTSSNGPGGWGDGAPSGFSYEGTAGTWTGSSSSVSFTAVSKQVRITALSVTYEAE